MPATVQLDVPVLLPEVNDRGDRCVVLLANELRATPGVLRVHLLGHADSFRLCIHHDPSRIDAGKVERLARGKGARVTEEIGHLLWAVGWIEDERSAREVGEGLRRLAGVLGAEATPQGFVRVEYDRRRVHSGAIERSLHALGLAREESPGVLGGDAGANSRKDRGIHGRATGLGLVVAGGVTYLGGLLAGAPA